MKLSPLQRQVVELSYRNKLSHLSSTLSAAPIIQWIYNERMKPNDAFVLSQGHAALALYCHLGRGQELLDKFGIHAHRSVADGIFCSTGSLGMGITVALGMAMAGRDTHCLLSDGECSEGAVWEVLLLAPRFPHLHLYVNMNGQSAYQRVKWDLGVKLKAVAPDIQLCVGGMGAALHARHRGPLPYHHGGRVCVACLVSC